ncbi:T9SS type A sorting domain-containing protein [Mangrovimonas spongiae]|uniref:T9SS C-terminal target domain-containing protein n=1 Tax=Mangrovimonas spongiae TaxID=2494697 RepID=A0A3R9NNW9_9FLAO|nr:T9SS type A sorting domain-containing protein [Mangrovimonas spongiae]RSK40255.1 T9SS C-terminal target domain-containing protein [Mangrovimonas spongiae]
MKLTTSFLIISLLWFSGTAQTIEKFSIDSGGTSVFNGNIELIYTIGEVDIQEVSGGSILVSEGFINPLQEDQTLDVDQEVVLSSIKVYPNPVSETLTVTSNTEVDKLDLYNILGKLELSVENKNKIDVNNLSSGMYLLKITIGDKQVTKRIIIK